MSSRRHTPEMFGEDIFLEDFDIPSTQYGSAYDEGYRDGVKAELERTLSEIDERLRVSQSWKDMLVEAGYCDSAARATSIVAELTALRKQLRARR